MSRELISNSAIVFNFSVADKWMIVVSLSMFKSIVESSKFFVFFFLFSLDSILFPNVSIALLLITFFDDCSESLLKIKHAFHSITVNSLVFLVASIVSER